MQIKWPIPGEIITTESGMEYTIGASIDQSGNFGLLYEGSDIFENPVAIKVFKPANRKFEEVQKQWQNETAILNRVRHPNVVFIHDAFICDNLFYIVFERAWGNLFNLIQQIGRLNELTVKEIARQLLFSLHYIHKENILHKDLTVYNILFFQSVQKGPAFYKISDFGISEEFTDLWGSTSQIAHQSFKPPELIKSGYTTLQSDLYHLGLILYFCLTARFPYDISLSQDQIDKAILEGTPRIMAERLGTSFGKFISILLRRREEYRFKTEVEAWRHLQMI